MSIDVIQFGMWQGRTIRRLSWSDVRLSHWSLLTQQDASLVTAGDRGARVASLHYDA